MLFCLQLMPKNCYGNQTIFFLFLISTYLIFLGNIVSGECVSGPSTESHVPTKKHPSPS